MQDKIDQTSATLGQIMTHAGEDIPEGWMLCDRKLLRRHIYPELFRVIGTRYGDGDGSNTAFNLPDIVSAEPDTRSIIFVGEPRKFR